jgi:Tol biopolymer transport system component
MRKDLWIFRILLFILCAFLFFACVTTVDPQNQLPTYHPDANSSKVTLTTCLSPIFNSRIAIPYEYLFLSAEILPFDWSSQQDKFAYLLNDSVWQISSPDYQQKLLLTIPNSRFAQLQWSPDGTRIAIYGGKPSEEQDTIWLVSEQLSIAEDLFGSNTQLQQGRGKVINRWLDNHNLTFYIHAGTGVQHLYKIDTLNNVTTPIVKNIDSSSSSSNLPQGGQYYFSPTNSDQLIIDHYSTRHLAWVKLDLSKQTQTDYFWFSEPNTSPSDFFQDWAPDGHSLLFLKANESSNVPDLWRWWVDDRKYEKLLSSIVQAKFSITGNQVLFLEKREQKLILGLLDLTSNRIQPYRSDLITDQFNLPASAVSVLSSSFDGSYLSYIDSNYRLWLISVKDSCQQQITETQATQPVIKWSPNTNTVAVAAEGQLQIFAAD